MQYKIINSIQNGNVTVEQLRKDTQLSPKALEITLKELVSNGILGINSDGSYYNAVYESPIQPQQKNITYQNKNRGDTMQKQNAFKPSKKQLNCTQEQQDFARLVKSRKGDIFDANQVLIHRGAQVLFAGAGDQAFRYKIAVQGFSDKEPVEYPILYLDWDDSALYDEGGLADQIREILRVQAQPTIQPTIQAQR